MSKELKISQADLTSLMKKLKSIFDVVRLVDPYCTKVIESSDKTTCFSVWNKDKRCENCISLKACADGKRKSKFEVKGDDAFTVISMPVYIIEKSRLYALELVNKVSDELQVNVSGTSIIARTMTEFDHKVYEDALTGVYNRRFFDEKLFLYNGNRAIIAKKVCLALFDINKFKLINDTYGHLKGDEVLKKAAAFFAANFRKTDTLIRIGGDEFLVIIPDAEKDNIDLIIKDLKERIKEIHVGDIEVSFGAGYAYTDEFNGSTEQIMKMFELADKNMYLDKNGD